MFPTTASSAGKESLILTRRRHSSHPPAPQEKKRKLLTRRRHHLSATISWLLRIELLFAWVPTQATFPLILSLHDFGVNLEHLQAMFVPRRWSVLNGAYQLIVALICLSTYSGNFLIDDQFLTIDSSFFTPFGLCRPPSTSHVYPLMVLLFDLFWGQSVLGILK